MNKAIIILTIAAFTFAPAMRAEAVKYAPINPALLYWQAAALLPTLTDDGANDLRDMASGQLPFDPAKARGLHIGEECLFLLHKAATSSAPCDWGLDLEEGPMASLPHVAKVRQLAAVAIVQAETLLAEGKTDEGIEWLLTAHRIARHAGAGDLLITNLVQNVLETSAIRAAARHCLGWNESTRESYTAKLKALPALHTVRDAFHGEQVLIDWVERRAALGGAAQLDIEKFIRAVPGGNAVDATAATAQMEPAALQATLTEWRALQSRTEAALDKPWAQSQPEIKALTNDVAHNSSLLIRNTMPVVGTVAEKGFALATLRTMLDAALEHGPALDAATAGGYRDALEGEPLRLEKGKAGTLILLAAHPHPASKELSLQLGR